jgi:transcription elongation factor GreA
MSNIYYCTPEGYDTLKIKSNFLKDIERPKIVEIMAESTLGSGADLSENNEYLQAKDDLDRIESTIMKIESKLSNARIINIKEIPNSGKVIFGTTVTVFDCDNENEITYKIVGEDESDIKENKVSLHSPIAKSLIGQREGDEVEVVTPIGERNLEIISIKHI